MQLTQKQKSNISKFAEVFSEVSETEDFKEFMKQRKEKIKTFKELKKEDIKKLEGIDLKELIEDLWASQIFGNKDYLVERIVNKNGLERIREEFIHLFFSDQKISKRYERFNDKVKQLGPASITEMLCYRFPKKAGIWNKKAKEALKKLSFDKNLPLDEYQINAEQYEKFNNSLKRIQKLLEERLDENFDLLKVDYFLFEVYKHGDEKTKEKEGEEVWENLSHNEVRDYVRDIGAWLGFEVDTEKKIAKGARVDALWKSKIANLGVINYVFEVQKSGNVKNLLVNLMKATSNPTVQKVIAVTDEEQIKKIKEEEAGFPKELTSKLSFWKASEVSQVHDNLSKAMESIDKLNLVGSSFPIEDDESNS